MVKTAVSVRRTTPEWERTAIGDGLKNALDRTSGADSSIEGGEGELNGRLGIKLLGEPELPPK